MFNSKKPISPALGAAVIVRSGFPSGSRVIPGNYYGYYGYNYGSPFRYWDGGYQAYQAQYQPVVACASNFRLTPEQTSALASGQTINVRVVNQCGQTVQMTIAPAIMPTAVSGLRSQQACARN